MDSKKTNLTPELKEIYDRVMNTSGGASAVKATGALPTTPATPPPANPLDPPSATMPSPQPTTPSPSAPIAPPQVGAPTTVNPTPVPPMTPPGGMPEMAPLQPNAAEDALTSTPARPISEGNTFAFSGTAKPVPGMPGATPTKVKTKTKISLPIIIVLGVVFIIIWGVFWAIIFGFIKR